MKVDRVLANHSLSPVSGMWERLGTPWKLVKPGEREPASQGLPRVGMRVLRAWICN